MTSYTCDSCEKTFKRKLHLLAHQRTAVCLLNSYKVQLNEKDAIIKGLEDKLAEEKRNRDTMIGELKATIEKKDQVIADIATKKITVNNNNSINVNNNNKYQFLGVMNFSDEHIKSQIESNFTETYLLKGQKGVAEFCNDHLITDAYTNRLNYFCTDPSRKVFVYKTRDGEIKKDIKCGELTRKITEPVIKKTKAINKKKNKTEWPSEEYLKPMVDINGMKEDNSSFTSTLASLTCNLLPPTEIEFEFEESEDEEEEEWLKETYTRKYFEEKMKMLEEWKDTPFVKGGRKKLLEEFEKYYKRFHGDEAYDAFMKKYDSVLTIAKSDREAI